MAENEKPEKYEPKIVDVQDANVEIPQYGDKLPAKISRLGMTTALEMFRDKARNPEAKIVVVFFETEDGVRGSSPLTHYAHPSTKSKIARFVRRYGQLKVGLPITIFRNEDGFWELDL